MQWRVCSLGFQESLFDILITDVSDEDHLHNLQIVLQQLESVGQNLKRDKCVGYWLPVSHI